MKTKVMMMAGSVALMPALIFAATPSAHAAPNEKETVISIKNDSSQTVRRSVTAGKLKPVEDRAVELPPGGEHRYIMSGWLEGGIHYSGQDRGQFAFGAGFLNLISGTTRVQEWPGFLNIQCKTGKVGDQAGMVCKVSNR